jgi:PAS domain S-box-containing protein
VDPLPGRPASAEIPRTQGSAALLTMIGEAAPGFLWVADASGEIEHMSRRWFDFTGQLPVELSRASYNAAIHPEDRGSFVARLAASVAHALPLDMEVRFRRHDGHYRWFAVRSLPFVDASGVVVKRVGMAVDIHDRKLAEAALRASEARERAHAEELATLLRAVPAAVWIAHDPECHSVTGSDQSYETLRLPQGANPSKTAPEPERPSHFRLFRPNGEEFMAPDLPLQKAAATGEPQRGVRVEVRFDDGTRETLYGNAEPLFDTEGRPRGAVSAFVDITTLAEREAERARLLEQARTARAEAEAANKMKDEFLAVVSHELRTPLNAILGWVGLLRDGKARAEAAPGGAKPRPDKLDRALEVIERNARAQAQLIEDLLDFSRITSGHLRLDVAPLDLAHVVEAAVEAVAPAAAARGVEVVSTGGAAPILGDAARLQQVAWNLLANAVKFTDRGGHVQIAVRHDSVRDRAVLEVRDDGCGIDPAFLPHLFEQFRQADMGAARAHGGIGLGLTIVRSLVERHGGTVRAHSEGVGRGSTFVVELPARPAEEPDASRELSPPSVPPSAPRAELASLAGLRVLIVDDQPDARHLLRALLTDRGAEVAEAASVAEALAALDGFAAHVLVSDIAMPGEDGISLVRRVRARADAIGGTPAIALTAFTRADQRAAALQAGFDAHLSKPLDPEELVETVARLGRR